MSDIVIDVETTRSFTVLVGCQSEQIQYSSTIQHKTITRAIKHIDSPYDNMPMDMSTYHCTHTQPLSRPPSPPPKKSHTKPCNSILLIIYMYQ